MHPDESGPMSAPRDDSLSTLTRHQRSVRTADLLASVSSTPDHQRRLLLDEVVLVNLRVAHAIARRFINRGIDAEDLEQVACEALVKAARRFDVGWGTDFLSFAVPTIRGDLQRHFRDAGWVVRPTRRVQETRWRLARTEGDLSQRLGRTPEAQDVRDELGLSAEEYAEAAAANGCFRPSSLDQAADVGASNAATVGDLLPSEDRDLDASETRMVLVRVMRRLSARDRRVLYLRYFEDFGQQEIGHEIGVT